MKQWMRIYHMIELRNIRRRVTSNIANRTPKRDKSRIAYYFRNFIKRSQNNTEMDTGSFIAHSLGGGLDMNLFPQRRDLNQVRSREGKQYRKMGTYAYKTPGTFVFSRPIYADDTWKPKFLEYIVLMNDCTLWTQIFINN